jgi:hypothetical protein
MYYFLPHPTFVLFPLKLYFCPCKKSLEHIFLIFFAFKNNIYIRKSSKKYVPNFLGIFKADRVVVAKNKLLDSYLLLDANGRGVKMHNLHSD